MPTMIRTFALITALALMWAITVGLLLYGGSWVLYLGGEVYGALAEWVFSQRILDPSLERYIPRFTLSVPDPVWASKWTLYVMGVMTLLPFVLNTLMPTRSLLASITGVPRKQLFRVHADHNLHGLLRDVVKRAKPGKPVSLYLIPEESPVALAVAAPLRGMVVLSKGLVEGVSEGELQWVIAHELAHIRYRDMLTGTIWIASIRGLQFFQRLKVMLIRAALRVLVEVRLPGIAVVLGWGLSVLGWALGCGRSLAIRWFLLFDRFASRGMELRADRYATQLQGSAAGIEILSRLKGDSEPLFNGLFATHPKVCHRIEAIQALPPVEVPKRDLQQARPG